MPQHTPRRRPGSEQDPRQPSWDSSNLDQPLDITKLDTAILVPPKRLHGIRAYREAQLAAHEAAGEYLREQQRVLMHQAVDWQDQMFLVRSPERRAEIQAQVDNLWATWNELDRQIRAHRQAMRTLRDADHPPA
jgi:hypothetical protein